jgi:hypothetical protein
MGSPLIVFRELSVKVVFGKTREREEELVGEEQLACQL